MEVLRSDGAGPEPASWLKRASLLKIPRLAKTSVLSHIHIGTGPAHPNGGNDEYPVAQVDRQLAESSIVPVNDKSSWVPPNDLATVVRGLGPGQPSNIMIFGDITFLEAGRESDFSR